MRLLRIEIIRLAWPVVAESLMGTLAQMVDMIFVSPLGSVAVAAVGLSTQPLWFLMGPFLGLSVGIVALVARLVGAKELPSACAAARQGFWMGLISSAVVSALIWWQAPAIIRLMGGEPQVVEIASQYLRALVPGLMALFWEIVAAAIPRAAGDTRTPFFIGLAVNIINIPLAWSMVNGHLGLPAMGLVGAGIATSIARILGVIALLVVLQHGTNSVKVDLKMRWRPDWGLIQRILRVSVPAAGERVATSLAYVVYTRMVSVLGTTAVAAHYTAVIGESVMWMVGSGLTTAIATLVGQFLGAKRPDQATATIREGIKIGAAASLPFMTTFLIFPQSYLNLFSSDAAVLTLASSTLRVAVVGEMPMVISLVLLGALSGAGDSRAVAGISLIGGWVVRLSFAILFLFGMRWGLVGAWLASVVDWIVRIGLLLLRFRGGRWREIQV